MVEYWEVRFRKADGTELMKDVRADTHTAEEAKQAVLDHGDFGAEEIIDVSKK